MRLYPSKPLVSAALLLALCSPASAQATVAELLREVRREEDETPVQIYEQLARIGTEEAYNASERAVGYLRKQGPLSSAYSAMRLYGGALHTRAISFVHEDAMRHRREPNQRAAVSALVRFGESAHDELEIMLRAHSEGWARVQAIVPLLPVLAERGDMDAAVLVLEYANPRGTQASRVRQSIERFDLPEVLELFVRHLSDTSVDPAWRRILVDHIGAQDVYFVGPTLVELLEDRDPDIQLRAIELVGERRELDGQRQLWKMINSRDEVVRHRVIIALGRIMGGSEKWRDELLELAEDRSSAARIGACVALAELRSGEAVEALHGLLQDEERAVRIEAVQQVGNVRRKYSIPFLIERLAAEKGRLRMDVASVLRLMTGLDNGSSRNRWKAWWDAEGAAFSLPEYTDAVAAESERRTRRAANASIATFYGLQVLSDRVYFVCDVSGSMESAAQPREGRSRTPGSAGTTRMEVARTELARAVEAFPAGDLFNLVLFESSVRIWQDELTEMDEDEREDSLEYINEIRSGGGTAIYDGLIAAFEDPRTDTIFLLTDGDPSAGEITDPARIRSEIARINSTRKIQINAISIGQDRGWLRGLAEDSGGQYLREG